MKIAVISNSYAHSKQAAYKLKKHLKQSHKITSVKPDMVIAIGGDGSFLRSIQKFWEKKNNTIFFSIHSGTLGFYSDFVCSQLDIFIKAFTEKAYQIEEAQVLQLQIDKNTFFALNDVRIESTHRTAMVDIMVNNKLLQKFRGNGLCFSTQTGSTAYNKSLGGSIMWPSTKGFQMTEIAPISNNSYSSLGSSVIFSSQDKITLKGEFQDSYFTFDTSYKILEGPKEMKISIAKAKVKIARFKNHYDFYQRLQDGFIK